MHQVPKIHTCFTPALYHLYQNEEAIVVVIDIFRATSAICTAFQFGVEKMIPVASLEEAHQYKKMGYLTAAERNAEKLDGFDFGNSPFGFMDPNIEGKTIAISTTNGTQAIEKAKGTAGIVIGSFLNISALAKWLVKQNKDVVLLCAGWKNRFNIEDSIFAGALTLKLIYLGNYETECDSTIAATHLYQLAMHDMYHFLDNSSHRKRLKSLNLEKDIKYCLSQDVTEVIPIIDGSFIIEFTKFEKAKAEQSKMASV
jgi:2-phosphosulfolactate phosphatase